MYNQQLGKNVVLVSDWNVNKLFLFLEEELCWERQPEEICKVGPVAMSEITGRLYAVITDYGDDDYDDDELNSSTIKMFDLNGGVLKDLNLDDGQLFLARFKDIEVDGDAFSLTDKLLVIRS